MSETLLRKRTLNLNVNTFFVDTIHAYDIHEYNMGETEGETETEGEAETEG